MATKNHGMHSLGGGNAVPLDEPKDTEIVETHDDAEAKGPSELWTYWSELITASLNAEDRFRKEGHAAEDIYFGEEDKAYESSEYVAKQHKTNIIHANIEILKPLIYSDNPDPIVRRRFDGDGNSDPTDRIAALVAQRLADFAIDTTDFESAMEAARDDWLVPGRGSARVMYVAEFGEKPVLDQMGQPMVDEATGQPMTEEAKVSENIKVKHWPWARIMYGAANSWAEVPFVAYETPMTKKQVEKRFDGDEENGGTDYSSNMQYPINGLKGERRDSAKESLEMWKAEDDTETSNTTSISAHDQCIVYEIWDRESKKVIWWSPHYRDDILDSADDPMGLEGFFNSPKPLLAVTKAGNLTPRTDIAFYKARADEVDIATKKLNKILNAISLSGVYPGKMVDEMKNLLNGDNDELIAIENWQAMMEKGGLKGVIDWLPIDNFVKVAQSLVMLREQAKQAMYEISGISDIVRGQSDPNETLGAQQIKGNYANIRLRDRQRKMQRFARDVIRLMVEVQVEHFDTKTIAEIVNMDALPQTDADLEAMNAQIDAAKQQYEQAVQVAQQSGQQPPPKPEFPFFEQTSWERVHNSLKNDMYRKFSLSIETDGTILQDQEEDKKQRVEFLQAFNNMVESMFPMAQSGVIDMKIIKEMLLFAVRGFPKSRTLEGMLATLPDKLETGNQEDTAISVAKIKAEVDVQLEKMKLANAEEDRKHELKIKGVDVLADAMTPKGTQNAT